MNNKKNKRKQSRKLLPLILAIIALVSMLAMSASAADPDCLCYSGDSYGSFYASEVTDYWIYECGDCSTLRYFYEPGSFARFEGFCVGDGPYFDGVNESLVVGFCGEVNGEGTCVDFNPTMVDSLPTSAPADNKGLVGRMISNIVTPIGGVLAGIGSAIVDFFNVAVLTTEGELTTFAVWALAFFGIGFGLGVTKFITNLVKRG